MIAIDHVLNNIGDFAPSLAGVREGFNPQSAVNQLIHGYEGGNAYEDREPGYGRVARVDYRKNNNAFRAYKEASTLMKRALVDGNPYARLMLSDAMRGARYVKEALSISDFPQLFGDVIDRAVLANYLETPYTWNMIARQSDVADFRQVKRFRIDGGTGLPGTLDASGNILPIPQGGQYLEDSLTDDQYTYRLQKYGKRMPFFWETLVNDDLNALKDTPARFGRGMRRGEEYFVTKLFANNATFYSTANKNVVKSSILTAAPPTSFINPPLTVTGLQQAMLIMMSQVDTTGQPIMIQSFTLVVGPGLAVTAQNIINQTTVLMAQTLGGDTNAQGFPNQMMQMQNWLRGSVQIAVNYELPIVDTTYGNKGWYLFANPNNGRPALEIGHLRGRRVPELFMKLPNSVAISEGQMGPGAGITPGTMNQNPMDGDFDTDSIHYKIRHCWGGTTIDPLMSVFSNGTNA